MQFVKWISEACSATEEEKCSEAVLFTSQQLAEVTKMAATGDFSFGKLEAIVAAAYPMSKTDEQSKIDAGMVFLLLVAGARAAAATFLEASPHGEWALQARFLRIGRDNFSPAVKRQILARILVFLGVPVRRVRLPRRTLFPSTERAIATADNFAEEEL